MVEVHFHDSEFTLLGKTVEHESDDEATTGAEPPEEPDGGPGVVGPLVALAVLVVAAFAVRRALAGDDDPETDLESEV